MRILWLCGIVIPDFSEEFMIKKSSICGWLTGMLHRMEREKGIDISLCFPIYDKKRLKDGYCNGHKYYTFLEETIESYGIQMVERFQQILRNSKPDIVHIWGSEYSHTTAMMHACKLEGVISRTVINIQGLAYVYAEHFFADIPEEYRFMKTEGTLSIEEDKKAFDNRGKCEIESIQMAQHVIGRTDWDRACVEAVNPNIRYYHCGEVLRDAFYGHIGEWEYSKCQKHSIFVSQATYPIKGFHYLLHALPVIILKYPDTHVYVAGKDIMHGEIKGPYAIYLCRLMEQYNLYSHISFLGSQNEEQMVLQYLKANVFVSASIVENESNSLSEARIIGTPSVGSYVGGAYDRIESGVDGFLYPHNEPALLAYYVCKIFENEENLCSKISAHSVPKMSRLIDPQVNADKNMDIYKNIVGNI